MVNTWKENTNNVVKVFFKTNIPDFILMKDSSYGPYWDLTFVKDYVEIKIGGDIGFSINIFIDGKDFPLWQYNRSVNEKLTTSKENILYQLNVLKQFLNEVDYG